MHSVAPGPCSKRLSGVSKRSRVGDAGRRSSTGSTSSWAQCQRLLAAAGDGSGDGIDAGIGERTGLDLLRSQLEKPVIATGLGDVVDTALLDGGFIPGNLYEITGATGTGKTQLTLTVAASCAAAGHDVMVVTTKDPPQLLAQRMLAMLLAKGSVQNEALVALDRVQLVSVQDVPELMRLLAGWPAELRKANAERARADDRSRAPPVLLIDTLSAVLAEFLGFQSWVPRWRLPWVWRSLREFAQSHGVIVVALAQSSDREKASSGHGGWRRSMPDWADVRLELTPSTTAAGHVALTLVRSSVGPTGASVELSAVAAGLVPVLHGGLGEASAAMMSVGEMTHCRAGGA